MDGDIQQVMTRAPTGLGGSSSILSRSDFKWIPKTRDGFQRPSSKNWGPSRPAPPSFPTNSGKESAPRAARPVAADFNAPSRPGKSAPSFPRVNHGQPYYTEVAAVAPKLSIYSPFDLPDVHSKPKFKPKRRRKRANVNSGRRTPALASAVVRESIRAREQASMVAAEAAYAALTTAIAAAKQVAAAQLLWKTRVDAQARKQEMSNQSRNSEKTAEGIAQVTKLSTSASKQKENSIETGGKQAEEEEIEVEEGVEEEVHEKIDPILRAEELVHADKYEIDDSIVSYPATRPIVVVGPSGCGKGTLIEKVMANHPSAFGFCVSHTTRNPRPGEVEGVNYHYTTKEAMQTDIDAGRFLEHANVHGNLYGTSFDAVADVAAQGQVCIIEVDVQGAETIKMSQKLDPSPFYVFIQPPSVAVLEQRLRDRGTETEEQVRLRLANAAAELEYGSTDRFDAVVVNDDLGRACAEFLEVLQKWYPHLLLLQKWEEAEEQQQEVAVTPSPFPAGLQDADDWRIEWYRREVNARNMSAQRHRIDRKQAQVDRRRNVRNVRTMKRKQKREADWKLQKRREVREAKEAKLREAFLNERRRNDRKYYTGTNPNTVSDDGRAGGDFGGVSSTISIGNVNNNTVFIPICSTTPAKAANTTTSTASPPSIGPNATAPGIHIQRRGSFSATSQATAHYNLHKQMQGSLQPPTQQTIKPMPPPPPTMHTNIMNKNTKKSVATKKRQQQQKQLKKKREYKLLSPSKKSHPIASANSATTASPPSIGPNATAPGTHIQRRGSFSATSQATAHYNLHKQMQGSLQPPTQQTIKPEIAAAKGQMQSQKDEANEARRASVAATETMMEMMGAAAVEAAVEEARKVEIAQAEAEIAADAAAAQKREEEVANSRSKSEADVKAAAGHQNRVDADASAKRQAHEAEEKAAAEIAEAERNRAAALRSQSKLEEENVQVATAVLVKAVAVADAAVAMAQAAAEQAVAAATIKVQGEIARVVAEAERKAEEQLASELAEAKLSAEKDAAAAALKQAQQRRMETTAKAVADSNARNAEENAARAAADAKRHKAEDDAAKVALEAEEQRRAGEKAAAVVATEKQKAKAAAEAQAVAERQREHAAAEKRKAEEDAFNAKLAQAKAEEEKRRANEAAVKRKQEVASAKAAAVATEKRTAEEKSKDDAVAATAAAIAAVDKRKQVQTVLKRPAEDDGAEEKEEEKEEAAKLKTQSIIFEQGPMGFAAEGTSEGVRVCEVVAGGRAETKGLQVGHFVTGANGYSFSAEVSANTERFQEHVGKLPRPVTLTVAAEQQPAAKAAISTIHKVSKARSIAIKHQREAMRAATISKREAADEKEKAKRAATTTKKHILQEARDAKERHDLHQKQANAWEAARLKAEEDKQSAVAYRTSVMAAAASTRVAEKRVATQAKLAAAHKAEADKAAMIATALGESEEETYYAEVAAQKAAQAQVQAEELAAKMKQEVADQNRLEAIQDKKAKAAIDRCMFDEKEAKIAKAWAAKAKIKMQYAQKDAKHAEKDAVRRVRFHKRDAATKLKIHNIALLLKIEKGKAHVQQAESEAAAANTVYEAEQAVKAAETAAKSRTKAQHAAQEALESQLQAQLTVQRGRQAALAEAKRAKQEAVAAKAKSKVDEKLALVKSKEADLAATAAQEAADAAETAKAALEVEHSKVTASAKRKMQKAEEAVAAAEQAKSATEARRTSALAAAFSDDEEVAEAKADAAEKAAQAEVEGGQNATAALAIAKAQHKLVIAQTAAVSAAAAKSEQEAEKAAAASEEADRSRQAAIAAAEESKRYAKEAVAQIKQATQAANAKSRQEAKGAGATAAARMYEAKKATEKMKQAEKAAFAQQRTKIKSAKAATKQDKKASIAKRKLEKRSAEAAAAWEAYRIKLMAAVKLQKIFRRQQLVRKENGIRALKSVQAWWRMRQARRALVMAMNMKGVMLALPGTVQGQTGWYQRGSTTAKFIRLPDGGWEQDSSQACASVIANSFCE